MNQRYAPRLTLKRRIGLRIIAEHFPAHIARAQTRRDSVWRSPLNAEQREAVRTALEWCAQIGRSAQ